ncbi:eCIS core domain-containing protein [Streptomyces sp. NPDC055722]
MRDATRTGPTVAPRVVHEVLNSPGVPLDSHVRAALEPRFGQDFSQVRVHTDARAASSADAVGARAYALGRHIVFAAGRYAPSTTEGHKLLAHELTHVVQQRAATPSIAAAPIAVGSVSDPAEQEAERVSSVIDDVTPHRIATTSAPRLARQSGGQATTSATPSPAPANRNTCARPNCAPDQAAVIPADLQRGINYVSRAIAALAASPLSAATTRALDWYFHSHSDQTVRTVAARLACIQNALNDTLTNNRWGCHPDDKNLAYVRIGPTPICTDALVDVCFTDQHFRTKARTRAQTAIHECAHRVGMSLGRPTSVPDVYRFSQEFVELSTADALRNSDSYALFAGAIAEGIPLVIRPALAVAGGLAIPVGGAPTWQAQLRTGVELKHPVLRVVHPTLGLGLTLIGEPTSPGARTVSPTPDLLASLTAGIRIASQRPDDRGVYARFFGGPAIAVTQQGSSLSAEAGTALGYRWRWLDVSTGVGYGYLPGRASGSEHVITTSVTISWVPGRTTVGEE